MKMKNVLDGKVFQVVGKNLSPHIFNFLNESIGGLLSQFSNSKLNHESVNF